MRGKIDFPDRRREGVGRARVKESSSIEQIVTGIILEVIDYHIDVVFRYKIN